MQPDDASALLDIADACRLIGELVEKSSQVQFRVNQTECDAVLYRLIIIGEATKRLSSRFRDEHAQIRWGAMAGLRDVVVHRYDRVDIDEIWDIASVHVPALLDYIKPLLPSPGDSSVTEETGR